MSKSLELVSKFAPAGDQPTAIRALFEGLRDGDARIGSPPAPRNQPR